MRSASEFAAPHENVVKYIPTIPGPNSFSRGIISSSVIRPPSKTRTSWPASRSAAATDRMPSGCHRPPTNMPKLPVNTSRGVQGGNTIATFIVYPDPRDYNT
jgi:hypothetical protein